MIYEVRTYDFAPVGVPEFTRGFAEALPFRNKYSRLGAYWTTDIGPLNQAIHVWPYDSPEHREQARAGASKDEHWPPKHSATLLNQGVQIFTPAPFMRPWGEDQELGNVYEIRTYTLKPGSIAEMVEKWAECLPYREKYSPMAACWYIEGEEGDTWMHIWPYKDLAERSRVRAEAMQDPHWPPPIQALLMKMENKIGIPAPFSPMR